MERPDDDMRKELEGLSPRLLKLKEQGEGFKIPDNYFQNLQAQVFEKIQAGEPAPESRKIAPAPNWLNQLVEQLQMLMQPRWAIGFATVALLIAVGIGWLNRQNQVDPQSLNTELAKVDPQSINAYIQDNLHEFDTETLMEFASNKEDTHLIFNKMKPEELNHYLDENLQELDDEILKELL